MDAYDFDGTIYDGDSSVDFTLFCLRRRPACLLSVPRMAASAALYALGRVDKTRMKEGLFSYLRRARVDDALLGEFWDAHLRKVKAFYLERRRDDDLVISASPEFLLAPACARLGVRPPIASRVDRATGRFDGPNCRGPEQVRRLREALPGARVGAFFSDSASDAPMAQVAERAWAVSGDRVFPWPESWSAAPRRS